MLDNRILENLFRRNYSEMVHLARVLLDGDEEAEDVVQDVFLRLADSDIPPRTDRYLLTAVHHACLNRIRQMRVHDQVKGLQPTEGHGASAAAGMKEADFQPIDKGLEWIDEIAAFVDEQLEEPLRSIFHLRFDEDLTISEIARRLGLNQSTTYKYLMQSIQRIRLHFKKH